MQYYIKKASDQDVTRTTVINSEAAEHFFNVRLPNRDDEAEIDIKYSPDTDSVKTLIRRKQDIRIFINREGLATGDLMLFTRLSVSVFSLEFIKPSDQRYVSLNPRLRNNFLLTDQINDEQIKAPMKYKLNTILFGPPGTGKTDSTIEAALEIVQSFSKDTNPVKRRAENREIFRSLLNRNIFFVTMHPSYSYEDFVQGIKPVVKEPSKWDRIIVINHIQDDGANDAVNNYHEDITKEYIYDSLVSNYKLIREGDLLLIKDRTNIIGYAEVNSIALENTNKKLAKCPNCGKADLRKRSTIKPKYLCVDCRTEFEEPAIIELPVVKHTAKFKHTLKNISIPKDDIIEDIIRFNPQVSIQLAKPSVLHKIGIVIESGGTLLFRYVDGILLKLCKYAFGSPGENFVIILDEINRANISKVFGEFITLLEDDKRIGASNELRIALPSGESVGVPSNLYVIGTMNTADRSIALVDIALRRRFQFVPVYPDPDVISNFGISDDREEKKDFMIKLNKVLRKDKGVDFQVGHAYFLKNNSLREVINQNIIPLLTEYYRNDLEKVKKLMQELEKSVDEDYYSKTGLLKY